MEDQLVLLLAMSLLKMIN